MKQIAELNNNAMLSILCSKENLDSSPISALMLKFKSVTFSQMKGLIKSAKNIAGRI